MHTVCMCADLAGTFMSHFCGCPEALMPLATSPLLASSPIRSKMPPMPGSRVGAALPSPPLDISKVLNLRDEDPALSTRTLRLLASSAAKAATVRLRDLASSEGRDDRPKA